MQALQFFEQDMVGVKGYDTAILEVLTRHNAWIVSKSSNANTITHYLSTDSATITRILADLQHRYPDASISTQGVAMVSIIRSDLAKPGLVFDALRALSDARVDVIAMQHQIRNVDVQFVVDVAHFDAAVQALHHALVEIDEEETEGRRAA